MNNIILNILDGTAGAGMCFESRVRLRAASNCRAPAFWLKHERRELTRRLGPSDPAVVQQRLDIDLALAALSAETV